MASNGQKGMLKMKMPLVSVVTPVYNGEKFINDCIQSVRDQTYNNFEYIILNNCSTDQTAKIAEHHASEDSRIRVLNSPEFLPLISNHNYALRQISPESDYCKIVHADDLILDKCLEHMVETAEQHPTAGIIGSYSLWGKKVVSDGIPLSTTFMTGNALGRLNLINQIYTFWSPSSLLLRSALIRSRDPFYNEEYLHSDIETCYELLLQSDFAFCHQVLSYIGVHDESATKKITSSYNKIILSNLDLFLRYGPNFLSAEEYSNHLDRKTAEYYRFLSNCLFDLRGKDFWRYHEKFCRNIGFPINRTKLAGIALKHFIAQPIYYLVKLYKAISKNH